MPSTCSTRGRMVGTARPAQRAQDLVRPRAAALHQLEVLDGRQAQRDVLAPEGLHGFGGRQPAQGHDLVTVHHRLLGRGHRGEEAGIEAERLLLGGDPVREVGQPVGGQREILRPQHGEERRVRGLAGRAVRLEALAVLRREAHQLPLPVIGQEHAHFLEGLADGAHPVAERLAGRQVAPEPGARLLRAEPADEALDVVGDVVGLDLAAREHVVARPRTCSCRGAGSSGSRPGRRAGRAAGPGSRRAMGSRGGSWRILPRAGAPEKGLVEPRPRCETLERAGAPAVHARGGNVAGHRPDRRPAPASPDREPQRPRRQGRPGRRASPGRHLRASPPRAARRAAGGRRGHRLARRRRRLRVLLRRHEPRRSRTPSSRTPLPLRGDPHGRRSQDQGARHHPPQPRQADGQLHPRRSASATCSSCRATGRSASETSRSPAARSAATCPPRTPTRWRARSASTCWAPPARRWAASTR